MYKVMIFQLDGFSYRLEEDRFLYVYILNVYMGLNELGISILFTPHDARKFHCPPPLSL